MSRRPSITLPPLDPDEIFLDASNLPSFDTNQFEGRIERPIDKRAGIIFSVVVFLIMFGFGWRLFDLQVAHGDGYRKTSENNRLNNVVIFPTRGTIFDRNGTPLAWSVRDDTNSSLSGTATDTSHSFLRRRVIDLGGFGHVLGYVSYPRKDARGVYWEEDIIGKDGIEAQYDEQLAGVKGLRITEEDAVGKIISQSTQKPPQHGEDIYLGIDARIQAKLYSEIKSLADKNGFSGGAAVMLDVANGEILALTSYPEYNPEVLSDGSNGAAIRALFSSSQTPMLNRAADGLYAPGSIVKPILAIGALTEGIIDPMKQIFSSGSISVPNPYDPSQKTVFRDWKALGWMDMRSAIAMSSDVYFYTIGGGFGDQKGLGIQNIEKYARMFGIGTTTGIDLPGEGSGTIPSPEWKAKVFPGDPWRIGDTYHTAIGQYGFQVTPLEMSRVIAAIANGGLLVTPHLRIDDKMTPVSRLPIADSAWSIVREGMRQGVMTGTVKGLDTAAVHVAGKTGTAEIGISKKRVNSWVMGFFPYEHPRYAFVAVMEAGPRTNLVGATYVMRQVLDWMGANTPDYFAVNQ